MTKYTGNLLSVLAVYMHNTMQHGNLSEDSEKHNCHINSRTPEKNTDTEDRETFRALEPADFALKALGFRTCPDVAYHKRAEKSKSAGNNPDSTSEKIVAHS